jgi:hypothetical protein
VTPPVSGLDFALEIVALIVLWWYANSAYVQAVGTTMAANAAKEGADAATRAAKAAEESNRVARDNARADLRAYVSLGDKKGRLLTIYKGILTLFFYNTGRTPARHLFVQFDLDPNGTPFRHLERITIVGGWAKGGMVFSPSGPEIPSGEVVSIAQPARLTQPKPMPITTLAVNRIYLGHFEYCDIFGGWHCDTFQVRYSKDTGIGYSLNTPMLPFVCNSSEAAYAAEIANEQGPENAKNMKPLPRCEQGD